MIDNLHKEQIHDDFFCLFDQTFFFYKISTYQVLITNRAMGALQLEQTHRMRRQLLKSVSLKISMNKAEKLKMSSEKVNESQGSINFN